MLTGPAWRLALLHGLNFLGVGLYLPFFPVWLGSKGFDDVAIGYLLALPVFVRMLASSFVAGLADSRISPTRLLSLLNALAACAYLALYPLDSLLPIALVMAASAVVLSGVIPLADMLTTAQIRAGVPINYGRVRLWGSVSFVLANLAAGYLVSHSGVGPVPLILAGCSLLAALAALLAPTPPAGPVVASDAVAVPAAFSGRFWLVVAATACVNAAHAAVYGFGSLHWRTQGFGDQAIGFLWAVGVIAEIGVFHVAGGVVARGLHGLVWVAASAAVAALRFGVMALDPGFWATAALQLLHGVSFGCMHLGALAAISVLAPDSRRGAAQGRYVAVLALVMGLVTVLSGYVYGRWGSGVFLAMVPFALLGLGLAVLAIRKTRSDTGQGRRI